jgi:hypothetical protein
MGLSMYFDNNALFICLQPFVVGSSLLDTGLVIANDLCEAIWLANVGRPRI